jgi:hypothetical protein
VDWVVAPHKPALDSIEAGVRQRSGAIVSDGADDVRLT